jgi:hypothetical protein
LFALLNRRITIQKITGAFLLLIFTISIAPRSYFHDLVATHKDFSNCDQLHKTTVLHTKSYHCHFDDLVVSAPFLQQAEQLFDFIQFHFPKQQANFYSCLFLSFSQHKENRGPPNV